ncbi:MULTISPECIES: type II toxin-antitoxin system tRNA(fMet)-specific endonuclease VapC [unclassified Aureimonas]|uniref:type II toxin-antitoxin system tRNA(fMet)-specific endonuclease VapC n=1 Tax=unclassified Aureimonas TaxID=2615206 RepID=UPI0006FA3BFC|nr:MULTISPECIES: type II toxin-antitoxin system VapC family toxin [unclassified Aureimonas]KQT54047.1 plasmid maintenance protein [Aureimonas sp. Leaf427]KQT71771.1 plasmid maintenance protein [Aureimonas sp. Leaf460]
MLDTNVCIHLLRNRTAPLRRRFEETAGLLSISTIVLHELRFGAEKSQRPDEGHGEIEKLIERLDVLPFDTAAAAHSGQIRAALQRIGQTIGTLDTMIAGHARSRELVVVTNNLGEFRRVEGLRCEDWVAPQA